MQLCPVDQAPCPRPDYLESTYCDSKGFVLMTINALVKPHHAVLVCNVYIAPVIFHCQVTCLLTNQNVKTSTAVHLYGGQFHSWQYTATIILALALYSISM